MTVPSTKSPRQLFQVLDSILIQTGCTRLTTVHLTPEVIRDLESLRDWCYDVRKEIETLENKLQDAEEVAQEAGFDRDETNNELEQALEHSGGMEESWQEALRDIRQLEDEVNSLRAQLDANSEKHL